MSKDDWKNRLRKPARPRFELSRFDIETLNVERENWNLYREELSASFGDCDYHYIKDANSCYNIGLDWCMCGEGQE